MKVKPAKAIALGTLLYGVLFAISYVSGQGSQADGFYQESWLEATSGLLAWFLPGLVAGSVTRKSPVRVGLFLGLLVVAFDFGATVLVFGLDWAVAALTVFPGTEIFIILSAVVFVYAGWKIQQINSQGTKPNVA